MTFDVLDPTHEGDAQDFSLAPRQASLEGLRVGIISNGKEGTKAFFSAFENELREHHAVADVVHRVKSNYSAPADAHILQEAGDWDVVIAGIGD